MGSVDSSRHGTEKVRGTSLWILQKLSIVVAPHSYIFEHGDKMEAYGLWRWKWMHPAKSLLDLGVVVAGNSDYPVSAALPLLRIQDLSVIAEPYFDTSGMNRDWP
jgi:hypothetical protein